MYKISTYKFLQQSGFTKHYRAADGGQPAVIKSEEIIL
jgi:hypothetical protein